MTTTDSFHPVQLAMHIANRYPDAILEFGKYRYRPQTIDDRREFIRLRGRELSMHWLSKTLAHLEPDQELAWHSRLKIGKTMKHIPMLDFSTGELSSEDFSIIENALAETHVAKLVLFSSGRSFHGYGLQPISPPHWLRFMGTSLLMNLPDRKALIDTRWVGHRLRAGYCSLRWSHNSVTYLDSPHGVREQDGSILTIPKSQSPLESQDAKISTTIRA